MKTFDEMISEMVNKEFYMKPSASGYYYCVHIGNDGVREPYGWTARVRMLTTLRPLQPLRTLCVRNGRLNILICLAKTSLRTKFNWRGFIPSAIINNIQL